MRRLLCAWHGGRRCADIRGKENQGAEWRGLQWLCGRRWTRFPGDHPPTPQFSHRRSAQGRPFFWILLAKGLGRRVGRGGLGKSPGLLKKFPVGKSKLVWPELLWKDGSSCIPTIIRRNAAEECHQPGKSSILKSGMALRKAAALGRTRLSLTLRGAGRSRVVGWSDRRKADLRKSRLLKRLSGNWLSGQPCQAEDRPTDVEGPASGPTHWLSRKHLTLIKSSLKVI